MPVPARSAALFLGLLLGSAAGAEPALPELAPGFELLGLGLYCPPPVVGQEPAPETADGHVNLLDGTPEIRVAGQEVPTVLGLGFGLVYLPDRAYSGVRMQGWRPGREVPDVWYADLPEGVVQAQGFTFDTRAEMIPGLWRFEAWDGETLLYRAEFEVLPAEALPGLAMVCGLTS